MHETWKIWENAQISEANISSSIWNGDPSGCLGVVSPHPFHWHLEDFVIPMRQRHRPRPRQPAENHGPVVVTKLDDNKDDIFIKIYDNFIICMAMGRDDPTKLPIWEKRLDSYEKNTQRYNHLLWIGTTDIKLLKLSLFGKETPSQIWKGHKMIVSCTFCFSWNVGCADHVTCILPTNQISNLVFIRWSILQSLPLRYNHDNLRSSLYVRIYEIRNIYCTSIQTIDHYQN